MNFYKILNLLEVFPSFLKYFSANFNKMMANQNFNSTYPTIHRHSKNVLIFFQIISFLTFCAVLHPVFRNRLLLGSTINLLAFILPASCLLLILVGMVTGVIIRMKSRRAMMISNGICFLSLLIVLGLTFTVYKAIGDSSQESFQKEFLKVLENPGPKAIKTLHKFQQTTQCCGVPLIHGTPWNQTSIAPTSPWASWYYYTMLDEDYIVEARISIKPSSKDVIIDELAEIEHRLKKARKSEDARGSVNEKTCEPPAKVLLVNVPGQLMMVAGGFVLGLKISV
ncbi:hypothetical protein CAEBREN_31964 [Caenorhabditis brenneri]|uniref:Uncharacterized protein n=1 Tax=Caenorhabditis brenneri TaxID=135651 RepID=G0P002_CAEBE|nr:hypothetical protein CAEBREN_31964 [Caenorhabditis brenneri]